MPSLTEAITHLSDVAIVRGKGTSTRRLAVLADYCIEELDRRGLIGAEAEARIEGGGRPKDWDTFDTPRSGLREELSGLHSTATVLCEP